MPLRRMEVGQDHAFCHRQRECSPFSKWRASFPSRTGSSARLGGVYLGIHEPTVLRGSALSLRGHNLLVCGFGDTARVLQDQGLGFRGLGFM